LQDFNEIQGLNYSDVTVEIVLDWTDERLVWLGYLVYGIKKFIKIRLVFIN